MPQATPPVARAVPLEEVGPGQRLTNGPSWPGPEGVLCSLKHHRISISKSPLHRLCFPPCVSTHHGKAREEGGCPAGGLQLGPAQVELPPGEGLHRVVVGGDQFQVAAADPVPVIHALVAGLRAGGSGGVHRYVELGAHGGSQPVGGRDTLRHPRGFPGPGKARIQVPLTFPGGPQYTPCARAMRSRGARVWGPGL